MEKSQKQPIQVYATSMFRVQPIVPRLNYLVYIFDQVKNVQCMNEVYNFENMKTFIWNIYKAYKCRKHNEITVYCRDASFQDISWFQEILQEMSLISGNFTVYKRIGKYGFPGNFPSISGNFDSSDWHLWYRFVYRN